MLDLVAGERLDRWAVGKSVETRLRLFLAVCDAVVHAHRHLVLHRDLKPANILVTADGQPKLLDFGIARLMGEDIGPGAATRLGLRPLTPEYASPEQLRGEPLATASDVYALGVILFELLTGEHPYPLADTTSPEERARRIETDPLPRPSAALRRAGRAAIAPARAVAGDLDAVVGKALAPAPGERYASATELAGDLRRYLAGLPVRALPPSWRARATKFVRRNRVGVMVGVVITVVLLGATAVSLRQAALARRERDNAERRLQEVRDLANVFLFDVHDAIAQLPGATKARQLLVTTGLDYLGRVGKAAADDPAVTRELALGYSRLAILQRSLTAASLV